MPTHRVIRWLCLVALAATAAATGRTCAVPAAAAAVVDPSAAGSVTFVESVPVETDLDLADVPQTAGVWREMIAGARDSLEIYAFYISPHPDGAGELVPLLAEITAAAERGVLVRIITDRGFHDTYPRATRQLDQVPGIAVRLLDAESLWGGAQHAKGFVADGERFFLGSQNWDWRALAHIHELGVVVRHAELSRRFGRLFALDWRAATPAHSAGAADRTAAPRVTGTRADPASAGTADWFPLVTTGGDTVQAALAASPPQALPPGVPWDQPMLAALLAGARRRIRVQLLSYSVTDGDGSAAAIFDDELRRAAARGVCVELILANWAKRPASLPAIQSLAALPNVEIRFTNLPDWSGGFIPFARVDHAKYVTVDGTGFWLGTANWGPGYFHRSRNVSLFLRGAGSCDVADRFFTRSWTSRYAETVDPQGSYRPPRRQ